MSVTSFLARCGLLWALGIAACAPAGGDPNDSDAGDSESDGERCGPSSAVVVDVIDGDTIVLAGGEKVRYLLVDTPEITNGKNECYGQEARAFNAEYVLGQTVELTYDVECTDAYGRLLAFVEAPDGEINTLLIARGFGCLLDIPPNGAARVEAFRLLEKEARAGLLGLWGMCSGVCGS